MTEREDNVISQPRPRAGRRLSPRQACRATCSFSPASARACADRKEIPGVTLDDDGEIVDLRHRRSSAGPFSTTCARSSRMPDRAGSRHRRRHRLPDRHETGLLRRSTGFTQSRFADQPAHADHDRGPAPPHADRDRAQGYRHDRLTRELIAPGCGGWRGPGLASNPDEACSGRAISS